MRQWVIEIIAFFTHPSHNKSQFSLLMFWLHFMKTSTLFHERKQSVIQELPHYIRWTVCPVQFSIRPMTEVELNLLSLINYPPPPATNTTPFSIPKTRLLQPVSISWNKNWLVIAWCDWCDQQPWPRLTRLVIELSTWENYHSFPIMFSSSYLSAYTISVAGNFRYRARWGAQGS